MPLPNRERYFPVAELGLRYKPARASGTYGAVDAAFADATRSATFGLREIALGTGYHFSLGRFALELGPRLGAGQPAYVRLSGTGFHAALDFVALYRVFGQDARRVGFMPLDLRFDLFVFARGGVWARPQADHAREIWSAAFGLGVRFGMGSDVMGSDDRWEAR